MIDFLNSDLVGYAFIAAVVVGLVAWYVVPKIRGKF